MAKTPIRNIYQQSQKLADQISLLSLMGDKERTLFVKEVQTLIDAARQAEQSTKSKQTKSQLQTIIEIWEEFLKYPLVRELPVVSKVVKTSQALIKVEVDEFSTSDFLHDFALHVDRLVSQLWSYSKVDHNSPMPILYDPELRAISDKFYGGGGARGHRK